MTRIVESNRIWTRRSLIDAAGGIGAGLWLAAGGAGTAAAQEEGERGRIGTNDRQPLASAMEGMVRMYRPHAAREDTVVFPAWKSSLTAEQLRERAEEFEEIEHAQFGADGFDEARATIAQAESALGLDALDAFTAPPPPHAA